jgi:hypothetical protein
MVTKMLSAPFYCARMTASFRAYHMKTRRVCGTLTRTWQHEDRVNLLSILNASVHMASTPSHWRCSPLHAATSDIPWLFCTEHSSPTLGLQLEGHQLTYAMYLSIFPMIITVIFRLMLWRPLAQLEDACRPLQDVFNDARDDIHVRC